MEIEELSPAATLACLGATVTSRRRAEVADLELVAHWCVMHEYAPTDNRGLDKGEQPGGIRLVDIGGEGTPRVQDLSLCEVAVARGVHTIAAQHVAADVMDLRCRLPKTWAIVQALGCEPWVARRVAALSRQLPLAVVHVVDDAVAAAIGGQSPGRVIDLCQAKIIEADPAGHARRLAEQASKRYVGFGRVDEHGLRHIIGRITAGDAYYIDSTLDRVADILAADPVAHGLPVGADRGLLRSVALGWLARPVDLLTLLLTHQDVEPDPDPEPEPDDEPDEPEEPEEPEPSAAQEPSEPAEPPEVELVETPATTDENDETDRVPVTARDLLTALRGLDPARLAPTAVLYVHLAEDALHSGSGVARVEGLGPHSLTQLRDLLRHTHVTVKPVIDLTDRVSTAAYEYPETMKERIRLLHHGDAFPHATATHSRSSRAADIDHPLGWTRDGPPDQTNSHTGQPLSRTPHRAKTHLPYRSTPMPGGEGVWRTPHGLHRVVDAAGTHPITADDYHAWTSPHWIQRALARIEHRLHTGQPI